MNLQDAIMIIILGLLAFYFIWWPDLKRSKSLKTKAKELNIPFYTKGDESLLDKLKYFYLFSISDRHNIKNMLHHETEDIDIAFFDYYYTIGQHVYCHSSESFKDGNTRFRQSIIYFCSTKLDLPQFVLQAEKEFRQMEDLQDIDFIDYPKFSDKYLLQGNPEESIRKLFNKELIEFFESISELELCAEGGGDQIIIYKLNERIDPNELNKFMDKGMEVFSKFTKLTETTLMNPPSS